MNLTISGKIQTSNELRGRIVSDETLSGSIETKVDVTGLSYPYYTGSYEVTPDMGGKTLSTKERCLREDVRVKAIPVYTVANKAGGNTITIGGYYSYE